MLKALFSVRIIAVDHRASAKRKLCNEVVQILPVNICGIKDSLIHIAIGEFQQEGPLQQVDIGRIGREGFFEKGRCLAEILRKTGQTAGKITA